ncbi:AfsR/SARP family transcriptional regulator [Saccharopolyspora rosea]|uniref:BTAD domain-containing putative transcriptional regulator n=1 Tax=Saccharopolyspora rosea TaxID=524884 RepID=A0ABW3FRQ2_9PSEU|nr:AfsR/SARP family transcriptional regulator [Saccharopolyspora rosea]
MENRPRGAASARFSVLGPLGMQCDGEDRTPSAPKVRQILALLVLRANQVVSTDALLQELWGDEPPSTALATLHTYIYHLRRLLRRNGLSADGADVVITRAPGYLLKVEPHQVDLTRFRELCLSGREHLDAGRHTEAVADLESALGLWTAQPLVNINLGPRLSAHVAELEENWLCAVKLHVEARMRRGLHHEVIGELRSLTAQYPLDEWLHAQLIRALDLSGRRGDALRAYQGLRAALTRDLGLDPSPEVQRLHQQVLAAGA